MKRVLSNYLESSDRKLARIEKIDWIKPIDGADNIELCGILGWQCIIPKSYELSVGDLVVFFEPDSVLPEDPIFEFMKKYKYRVKPIKLKGVMSQGLVMPLDKTLDYIKEKKNVDIRPIYIGFNLTDYIGVRLYSQDDYSNMDNPINSKGGLLPFPLFIPKTKENRLQNLDHLNYLYDKNDRTVFYITEKLDGTSSTFAYIETNFKIPGSNPISKFINKVLNSFSFIKNKKYYICSRNYQVTDTNTVYYKVFKKYNLKKVLKKNPNIIIQGEICGPRIQKNRYDLKDYKLFVFNVIKIDLSNGYPKYTHFNYERLKIFCVSNNLDYVPSVKDFYLIDKGRPIVDQFLEMSYGKSLINPKIEKEGIVVRSNFLGELRESFKVINPEYLIKYD